MNIDNFINYENKKDEKNKDYANKNVLNVNFDSTRRKNI
jgi:hypothetical protein